MLHAQGTSDQHFSNDIQNLYSVSKQIYDPVNLSYTYRAKWGKAPWIKLGSLIKSSFESANAAEMFSPGAAVCGSLILILTG